jgi:hypothetical protein
MNMTGRQLLVHVSQIAVGDSSISYHTAGMLLNLFLGELLLQTHHKVHAPGHDRWADYHLMFHVKH